jgi:diguanylate cyclase (GGDEF)-like protein/PAS domain S-box-containing protein
MKQDSPNSTDLSAAQVGHLLAERASGQPSEAVVDARMRAIDRSHGRVEFAIDGTILDVNENYLKFTGYQRSELLGQHYQLLVTPEEIASPDYTEFWQKLVSGEFQTREVQRCAKDGSCRWIQSTFNPVFDDEGAMVKIFEYAIDVTSQRIASDEIRKLYAAVDQSSATILIADAWGMIEYANQRFTEMTGYSRHEAVGSELLFAESELLDERLKEVIWSKVKSGQNWKGELCSRYKGGDIFWESVSISPVQNAAGEITHFLAVKEDITDQKRMLNRMHSLAYHDSLTGLPNRTAIVRAIQRAIDSRSKSSFALLFLDFDRFKLINDSLGHDAGDELLKQISQRLQATIVQSDHVMAARLGGDEFLVLLPNLEESEQATRWADQLLRAFGESYRLCGHTVHSMPSIGIVMSDEAYSCATEMIRDADLAMYEAKSVGGNCWSIFNQHLQETVKARLKIECDLRHAIAREELALYYQPIVSLETGALEGVEALVRWFPQEGGVIDPDAFVPVAEETGMIVPIGEWVLNEACRQMAQWQETLQEFAPRCVHVNVSRIQLMFASLEEIVSDALVTHGLAPERLHIEVTESIIVEDQQRIVSMMNRLKSIGVKIDMDDFGTGHSSLSCLHEFPIDVLKIDRSFIGNIKEVHEFAALLHAVLTLADNLNLQVISEGVEDAEQLAALQAMGCELGQGYYFSKPVSAQGLEDYVRQAHRGKQPSRDEIGCVNKVVGIDRKQVRVP